MITRGRAPGTSPRKFVTDQPRRVGGGLWIAQPPIKYAKPVRRARHEALSRSRR